MGKLQINGDLLLSGSISFKTSNTTAIAMQALADGNGWGQNLLVGAGGNTFIGGGEAASEFFNAVQSDVLDGEDVYLVGTNIRMYTNCDAIANRKLVLTLNSDGTITLPGSKTINTSGNFSGNAATATKLATARTITLTGSVTGSGSFDGSGNLSISTTTNHSHSYLPLSGGTMTGDITLNNANVNIIRSGTSVSWYQGRNTAMIKTTSYSGYDAILSMKTTSGDWALGVYSDNKLYFTYILDSNYNANTNTTTAQIRFNPDGTISASGFSGNASSASSVPWSGVTGKPSSFTPASHTHNQYASIGAHNNLTASGNEFTFASGAFSGEMYINYRTASGSLDGNITRYKFQNGKGSNTAIECSYVYGTAQAADYATSSGSASYAGYLSVYTNYTSQSALDGFLSAGVLRWATAGSDAVPFSNDGSVVSIGWSAAYGSQIWLDDGSGPPRMAVRNRTGGTAWNGWRHCIMSSSYTYYGGTLPTSGQQTGDVFFKT